MRGRFSFSLLVLLLPVALHANGVCFPDASEPDYLELVESEVNVEIENQVAIVTTTQMFRNSLGGPFPLTYAFPMYEDASATSLSWRLGGEWEEAIINPTEPPEIPGQDNIDDGLASYLGPTPLFFRCPDCVVAADDTFRVRLTYVQLLPYDFGNVELFYPNDYALVQDTPLDVQRLHLELNSLRTIENVELLSHGPADIIATDHRAEIHFEILGARADTDYHARYSLSLSELGLFSMSSSFAPEELPDSLGNGFFTFVVEPEPDTSVVIDKVFTLIVDRSGSMRYGGKIEQARDAASFIVENLNDGDHFNIVDFSTNARSLFGVHTLFTPESQAQALDYIHTFAAAGSTNISGAFDLAVPQFAAATDSTANIIVFFTDGRPNGGIENQDALLQHVHGLRVNTSFS